MLVASTTTLAHQAAFDALMTEKDAIVLDHQVHQSVHQASNLARARGTRVQLVRHEELGKAREVVTDLARRHHTVWFGMVDVLSMYGDLAPFELLESLLAVAPNVRLYVDDAHGMNYVLEHGAYRQALYQMVHHAHLRGVRHVHLGMDADREKARYGTEVVESVMYGQARDHYTSSLLRGSVAEVGVRAPRPTSTGDRT